MDSLGDIYICLVTYDQTLLWEMFWLVLEWHWVAIWRHQRNHKSNKRLTNTYCWLQRRSLLLWPKKHREENPTPYTLLGPRQLLVRTPTSSSAPCGEELHVGPGGENKVWKTRFYGYSCMNNHSTRSFMVYMLQSSYIPVAETLTSQTEEVRWLSSYIFLSQHFLFKGWRLGIKRTFTVAVESC